MINENGKNLFKGQQMRIGIAHAFVSDNYEGIKCILRIFKRIFNAPIVLGTLVFVKGGQAGRRSCGLSLESIGKDFHYNANPLTVGFHPSSDSEMSSKYQSCHVYKPPKISENGRVWCRNHYFFALVAYHKFKGIWYKFTLLCLDLRLSKSSRPM